MKKKALVILIGALVFALLLFGCTENLKQDAIPTDFDAATTISSNGGLAVRAGKYVYYINGYSDNTGNNTFGSVLKGAIVRAELNEQGVPDPATNKVIVPKIVYNTLASSGLYIQGQYLYYSSPNTEKNKEGIAKYGEMNLMRTKLDGTGTETIKKFSDYTPVYSVTAKGILYYSSNELHFLDGSKDFEDVKVAEGIGSNYFVPRSDNENSFAGASIFVKTSEETNTSHQIVYFYRAGDGAPTAVIDGLKSYETLLHPKGYTFTIVGTQYLGEGLRLIYRKSDGGSNTISAGTYSCDIGTDLAFDESTEECYVRGTSLQYTNLFFLSDDAALATTSSGLSLIQRDRADGSWKTDQIIGKAVTLQSLEQKEEVLTLYYFESSKLYRLHTAKLVGEGAEQRYELDLVEPDLIFSSSYHSSWLQPDTIGNVIYFFNSNVLNYTYTLNLDDVTVRDSDTMVATLLSMMSAEDEISAIS